MQPLPGRIGLNFEYGGDTHRGQLLPGVEAQHLDVGVVESSKRREHTLRVDIIASTVVCAHTGLRLGGL